MIAFLVLLPFSCFFEYAPFVSIAPSLTLTYINYDNYRVSSCLYVNRDIEDCAEQFKARNLPLHGLINNIGTENPPDIKSKEGFDVSLAVSSPSFPLLQIAAHSCKMPLCSWLIIWTALQPTQASNYLGHFYLTHLLLEKLMETPQSRVVNLTSLVEPNGTIEWTDIGYARDCILTHACNLQMLPQA